jgi:alpha-glucosidase
MARLVLVFLLNSVYFSSILANDWWETASFYQIYPRSFKDSDGDGIGDLNGIIEKLPYLKDIGIDAFWLSPIFKSPMADFGYDISDFYDIQPEYGTMEDFERLVASAEAWGIKVILDFVPNHSSDESELFQKSVQREEGYEDFYMWHPGITNSSDPSKPLPPSNWISGFRFSAWQWNDVRKEFYYHAFAAKQPDLNYRNPKVVEEMKNVLRFWLDKGVAGFRIDAVPNLFEVNKDASGNYPDEPKSNNSDDPDDPAYLTHNYTTDQPETIDMVYQWRAVMDEYQQQHGGDARVILAETYSPIDIAMQYYGNQTAKGAHMPFNFQLILNIKNDSNAEDYKRVVDLWMSKMPSSGRANWVVSVNEIFALQIIIFFLISILIKRWEIMTKNELHQDMALIE